MKVRAFDKMNLQERAALVANGEVKTFITRAKDMILRKISNAEITVPTVLRPMIREEISRESKMLKYVNHIYVPGDARIPVMGAIPEAVWTEQCAKLNELDFSMYMVELEAYKVGGYNAVCRYLAEDSEENILDTMMYAIAAGIAKALDKAILFGTGRKMPLGIVTRLIQITDPGDGGKYTLPWKNLIGTNAHTISRNASGEELIKSIMTGFAAADTKYGTGKQFFAMHPSTHLYIMAQTLSNNAAGALVAGMNDTMPVIGGDIVKIDDMPQGLIVGGYGVNYTIGERGNMTFDTNDRLRWIEEEILVKGTARYDGKPTNPAAFVAFALDEYDVEELVADVTFAPDNANTTAS